MKPWLKNSDGKPDAALTLAVVACLIVFVKVLAAGVTFGVFSLGQIDGGIIGAVLTPTLGAYVGRRWTDRHYADASDDKNAGKDVL